LLHQAIIWRSFRLFVDEVFRAGVDLIRVGRDLGYAACMMQELLQSKSLC